jgi:hypothetical protein
MKTIKTTMYQALLGLSLAFTTPACLEPAGDPAVSETASNLLVQNWSGPTTATKAFRSGQVATLNGTTYMVSSGECGSWTCWSSEEADDLYWQKMTATGWTSRVRIPGQLSLYKVSLAAFNGYLYMVHTGHDTTTATWISRFDPATEQWSANFQIPYPSFSGPPAIVAFDNKLYFVGTTLGSYAMWTATMTAGEIFSTAVPLVGHASASRPSVAVFNGRLYVAHMHGQTGEIVVGNSDGSTWTSPQFINAGLSGAPIRGVDPVLAVHNGFLHLIHRRPEDNYVWWTYFNGCTWPAEITLATRQSSYEPSLTQGGPGLVLITTDDITWNGIVEKRQVSSQTFTHPVPRLPPPPPTCGVVSQ